MTTPRTPETRSEYDVRKDKVQQLRDMGIQPYAQGYEKQHSIADLIGNNEKNLTDDHVSPFRDINDIITSPRTDRKTAGRLTLFRAHGKLSFGRLMDESGEIQLMFHRDACALVEAGAATKKTTAEHITIADRGESLVCESRNWLVTWLWRSTGDIAMREDKEIITRNSVTGLVVHPDGQQILFAFWKKADRVRFPGWGIEDGETAQETIRREIIEETGYTDFAVGDNLWIINKQYYHWPKGYNIIGTDTCFIIKLHSLTQQTIDPSEAEKHDMKRVALADAYTTTTSPFYELYIHRYHALQAQKSFADADREFLAYMQKKTITINRSSTPLFDQFPIKEGMPTVHRSIGIALVYNPRTDSYLCHKRKADWAQTLIGGGIEEGEDAVIATMREVQEETGYTNLRFVTELPPYRAHYRHATKQANYYTSCRAFVFELVDETQVDIDPIEYTKHTPQWVHADQMKMFLENTENGTNPMYDHLFVWDEWMKVKNHQSTYTIIRWNPSHREQFKKLRMEMVVNEPIAFGGTIEKLEKQSEQERKNRIDSKIFLFALDKEGNFIWTINLTPYDDETDNGERDHTTWMINGFYVSPKWRWKGIAKALMNQWLFLLQSEYSQIKRVVLWVSVTQENAIKLYEKNGWTKIKFMNNQIEHEWKTYNEREMEYILSPYKNNTSKKNPILTWSDATKLLDYIQTLPVIFIDGIHTSIIKKDWSEFWQNLTPENLEPNHELRSYLDTLPYVKIIVTNADEDLIRTVLRSKIFGNVFTLNNNPNKNDPSYYEKLLEKTFGEGIDKYIYFDHSQANLDSAKQAGMEWILYTGVQELKKEIDKKLAHRNLPSPVENESKMSAVQNTLLTWADATKFLEKMVDIGDFIGVRGELFHTHKGELTLFVSEFSFLAKALRPLGDKFHGIAGQETAYRQRYLDMIHNRETMDRMKFRSNFVRALREFYRQHNFLEIDCPVLTPAASGAAAKPFVTHHYDFDRDYFLRICNETELKKATVWGLENVFTIATVFRNEGSDPSHLQEFTMLEHQAVFKTVDQDMDFAEKMFDHLFDTLRVDRVFTVKDKQGNPKEVNFTTPRPRIDYVEGVNNASWLDITSYSIDDADKLRTDIRAKGIEFEGMDQMGTMTLIDYLYKKVLRPTIAWPAFVYNYPSIIAPLARIADDNPNKCEKRQVVVNGREITNAYWELVDPIRQTANFQEQAKAEAGGDAEATSADDAFVHAMEYGMPCQAWFGMGVDRVIAIMSWQENLRDVVMFPLMKPENNDGWWMTNDKKQEKKSDLTQITVILLNQGARLEPRQEMNTIAHLTSAFGARQGTSGLFSQNTIQTKDQHDIFLNINHAIMIKTIPDNTALQVLRAEALNEWLHIADFTREMIQTTDDKKIVTITAEKSDQDIEHLGLLISWPKKVVEAMTKGFGLYGKK